MMFASKTPRDLLNHDPKPYRKLPPYNVGRSSWPILHPHAGMITEYDPRPEFDHVQHNEPNPILAGNLREAVALDAKENPPILDLSSTARYILNATYDEESFEECFTPEELDHARRVLTRLANLTEGATA